MRSSFHSHIRRSSDRKFFLSILRILRETPNSLPQSFNCNNPTSNASASCTLEFNCRCRRSSTCRFAAASGAVMRTASVAEAGCKAGKVVERPSHQRIEKIYLPQKTKQTQLLGNGDAKAGAVELAQKLHTEARVF